jgi:hypothetical protein
MKQIAVQAISPQARQRLLASLARSRSAGIFGKHLRDEEHLIPPPCDCLAHDLLRPTGSIHLRSVDMIHPEVEALAERREGTCTTSALDEPTPLPYDGHLTRRPTKCSPVHSVSPPSQTSHSAWDPIARQRHLRGEAM